MWHAIDRFVLHFCSSACVVIAFLVLSDFLQRVRRLPKLAGWWCYIVPAVPPLLIAFGREAWDVGHGQPLYKAFTDQASWVIGIGVAIWALYRIAPMLARVNAQIRGK